MGEVHSTSTSAPSKPAKPSDDFPLFPHATGRWAKKIDGKLVYFGPWADPKAALGAYKAFAAGKPKPSKPKPAPKGDRPAKPRADFPLFPHASGRWCKKIRGKLVYFGPWDDPEGALEKYEDEKKDLEAGRTPRATQDKLTLFTLTAKFLTTKKLSRDTGELSPRSFIDYLATCNRLLKAFGKKRLVSDLHPDDFERLRATWAKDWGPVRLGGEINRTRIVFRYGTVNGLIDKPIIFGEGFKRPSKKTLRLLRQKQGPKLFTPAEIRKLLDTAGPGMKAMILLGIGCGFGNGDIGRLPISALDLDGGWVTFPRPKTAVERRAPLWPETIAAIREWLQVRPEPRDAADADLVFLTRIGNGWHTDTTSSPLSAEMKKLLRSLRINGRKGLGFYTLRHVFQTIGDESADFLAVRAIMGHAGGNDIADHYRERLPSDERLRKVSDHVRVWLFGAVQ